MLKNRKKPVYALYIAISLLALFCLPAYGGINEFIINSATFTINNSDTLNVDGSIIINSGGVLAGGSAQGAEIKLSGNWENSGTFIFSDSTVEFYGSQSSTITGNTSFYDFKCSASGKTIYFESGATQTVEGTLTLSGDPGYLYLRSGSQGTRWAFDFPNETQKVFYVDVEDSDVQGNDIYASNSIDSANNKTDVSPRWIFEDDTTPPAAITTLSASSIDSYGGVELSWESPGDDGWEGTLGTESDPAEFRIQHSSDSAINWGTHESYDISISTWGVEPYQLVSATMTLAMQATYYMRIWSRDGAGNWSDISKGATAWVRIAPAAITDLYADALHDGDVELSWSSPGNDGWENELSTGVYRIRWSTDSGVSWEEDWDGSGELWQDYDNRYEINISTSSSPLESHSEVITGLCGNVTYYFRIWSRDEDEGANKPGNWSDISNVSTATVYGYVSMSVTGGVYDFGELRVKTSSVSVDYVTLTNTGNMDLTYIKKISTITLVDDERPSLWKSTDTAPGHDMFMLYSMFHSTRPAVDDITVDDVLICNTSREADEESVFTFSGESEYKQTGTGVPKGEERMMWIRLDLPLTLSRVARQSIRIGIDTLPD